MNRTSVSRSKHSGDTQTLKDWELMKRMKHLLDTIMEGCIIEEWQEEYDEIDREFFGKASVMKD